MPSMYDFTTVKQVLILSCKNFGVNSKYLQ